MLREKRAIKLAQLPVRHVRVCAVVGASVVMSSLLMVPLMYFISTSFSARSLPSMLPRPDRRKHCQRCMVLSIFARNAEWSTWRSSTQVRDLRTPLFRWLPMYPAAYVFRQQRSHAPPGSRMAPESLHEPAPHRLSSCQCLRDTFFFCWARMAWPASCERRFLLFRFIDAGCDAPSQKEISHVLLRLLLQGTVRPFNATLLTHAQSQINALKILSEL